MKARFYHDVRMGIDVGPKYNFYMGVDNLTNTKPPFAATGIGGQTGLLRYNRPLLLRGRVGKVLKRTILRIT